MISIKNGIIKKAQVINCYGHKVTFKPPLIRGLDFFKIFTILIVKIKVMARKINSEQIVDNENFKLKIGTTDKKNPKIIYIDCGFFVEPKEEKEDYSESIKYVEGEARRLAKKISNATKPESDGERLFKKDFIFVFEVAETRIFYGKKSYISFQLHLKQEDNIIAFKEIAKYTTILAEFFVNTLSTYIKDEFEISKTKN